MQSIGRYQVKRELGRGAMGVVYLAEDPAIGRPVAIKTINVENLAEADQAQMLRDRLIREARSAGILSHPGIVTIYDIQQTEHSTCIVMEFVEGETLYDRMTREDIEPASVLEVLEETAVALDYAHSKGVLHRDIKPANLMFTTDGHIKIADFGVAKLSSQKTATTGMVLGTPSYMAPEQIANKPIGPATDQFSLAVVAFELIAGQKPFAADSMSSLLYSIVFQDPISVRQLNPSLAPAAETVLRKALSKEPGERYANCAEFIKVLRSACETKKTWKPIKTIRGGMIQQPLPSAAMGSNMPSWGATAPPAATPPPPAPAPPPPPSIAPQRVAPPSVASQPIASPSVASQSMAEPPMSRVAARAADSAPAKKFPVAPFLIGFAAIAAGFITWQLTQPKTETAHPIAAEPPVSAPATAVPAKSAPAVSNPGTTAAGAVVAKPQAPAASGGSAVPGAKVAPVEIATTPARATVTFQNQQCVTPCQLELPYGDQYVRAELEGYKTSIQLVRVPQQMSVAIELKMPSGSIEVRGPAGATIFVNGQPWKDKAPTRMILPAGTYSIQLQHPNGAKDDDEKFQLTEGKMIVIN